MNTFPAVSSLFNPCCFCEKMKIASLPGGLQSSLRITFIDLWINLFIFSLFGMSISSSVVFSSLEGSVDPLKSTEGCVWISTETESTAIITLTVIAILVIIWDFLFLTGRKYSAPYLYFMIKCQCF